MAKFSTKRGVGIWTTSTKQNLMSSLMRGSVSWLFPGKRNTNWMVMLCAIPISWVTSWLLQRRSLNSPPKHGIVTFSAPSLRQSLSLPCWSNSSIVFVDYIATLPPLLTELTLLTLLTVVEQLWRKLSIMSLYNMATLSSEQKAGLPKWTWLGDTLLDCYACWSTCDAKFFLKEW